MGQTASGVERIVDDLVEALSKRIHVERVILFGSRARGDASDASDVDLLIVSSDFGGDILADYALLYQSLPLLDVDVDMIPSTPTKLASVEPDTFLATVLEDGVTVYPRAS
jgi:predicted nucleotidyltransferase